MRSFAVFLVLLGVFLFFLPSPCPAGDPPVLAASGGIKIWTSADGKTIQAKFLRLEGENVVIQREDGKTFTVPLAKLSPESQAMAKAGLDTGLVGRYTRADYQGGGYLDLRADGTFTLWNGEQQMSSTYTAKGGSIALAPPPGMTEVALTLKIADGLVTGPDGVKWKKTGAPAAAVPGVPAADLTEKIAVVRTRSVILNLLTSIKAYQVEYNRFPAVTDQKASGVIRARGELLVALLGKAESKLNPRMIKFVDLPEAGERKPGLKQVNGEPMLVDAWGEPLYLILDIKGKHELPDPSDPSESLALDLLIFSSGPDREAKTWGDNLKSWK